MSQATRKVHIFEEFKSTIGLVVLVKNDQRFEVGQMLIDGHKYYRILGIHPNHEPDASTIALRVEAVSETN